MYKRAVAPEQRRPLPSRDGRTEKIDRLWLEIAPPCGRGRVERGRRCKVVVQTGRKGKAKGGWGRDRAAARSLSSSRKSMRSQFRAKVARTVTESTRRKERKDERKEGRKTRGREIAVVHRNKRNILRQIAMTRRWFSRLAFLAIYPDRLVDT